MDFSIVSGIYLGELYEPVKQKISERGSIIKPKSLKKIELKRFFREFLNILSLVRWRLSQENKTDAPPHSCKQPVLTGTVL